MDEKKSWKFEWKKGWKILKNQDSQQNNFGSESEEKIFLISGKILKLTIFTTNYSSKLWTKIKIVKNDENSNEKQDEKSLKIRIRSKTILDENLGRKMKDLRINRKVYNVDDKVLGIHVRGSK